MARGGWALGACALWLCALAPAQPRPSGEEQARTIETARANALHYAGSLPDFICTEKVQQITTTGLVQRKERLAIQVTYFGQRERYKLLSINGGPADRPLDSLPGLVTGGEFGTMLFRIFDPASAAEFAWTGWTTVGKRRAATYSFRVARAHSHHIVGYRTSEGELRTCTVGEQGAIDLDTETARVLRIGTNAAEIPEDFPVLRAFMLVEYGYTEVAGQRHLLPARAASELVRPGQRSRNVVTFTAYRKFTANSSIDFK